MSVEVPRQLITKPASDRAATSPAVIIAKCVEASPVNFSSVMGEVIAPPIPTLGTGLVDVALNRVLISNAKLIKIDSTTSNILKFKDRINDGADNRKRPRRPRCPHGRLKMDSCRSCDEEKNTQKKAA